MEPWLSKETVCDYIELYNDKNTDEVKSNDKKCNTNSDDNACKHKEILQDSKSRYSEKEETLRQNSPNTGREKRSIKDGNGKGTMNTGSHINQTQSDFIGRYGHFAYGNITVGKSDTVYLSKKC